VFDPYAEFAEIEQRKEDKIARKKQEEKDEKERLRKERKQYKINEKERRKREREGTRGRLTPDLKKFGEEPAPKKILKEPKGKKVKKTIEKKRSLKRAQNENPEFWIRQAWDVPQRNRAITACLRFGFTRFCRIRNESNLTSLPIQDFEVFFRSYIYQLSLQVAVTFLRRLKEESWTFTELNLKIFLYECLGITSTKEVEWLSDCLSSGMRYYLQVESESRFLRLPRALAEPTFIGELRRGPALRSLRRVFLLSRIQRVVEYCLDESLTQLGYEQLAKRGCQTSNISTMDVDLKARLVSTEELSLAINFYLKKVNHILPVVWWDRSCDIALLIGTFVHGLGNYDAMLNDAALPFDYRIAKFVKSDEACVEAQQLFDDATVAARKVFDDALVAFDLKEQQKNLVIISAAAANQTAREKDALALREGGAAADAVHRNMPDQVANNRYEIIDGDDSHYVTLARLQKMMRLSIGTKRLSTAVEANSLVPMIVESKNDNENSRESLGRHKLQAQRLLTMPDARVLDCRLGLLLEEIERNLYTENVTDMDLDKKLRLSSIWPSSNMVKINCQVRAAALSLVSGVDTKDLSDHSLGEYMGIGINGSQCAASHRTLDDATDYCIGAASADLSDVSCTSSRYVRAMGVPMNLTRFAISALVHADASCVEHFLDFEKNRNLSEDKDANGYHVDVKKEDDAEASVNSENGISNGKSGEKDDGKIENSSNISVDASEKVQLETITPSTSSKDTQKGTRNDSDGEDEEDVKVPKVFEENARLRASVCVVVLHYGLPSINMEGGAVSKPLWTMIKEHCGHFDESNPDKLFNYERFHTLVKEFNGDTQIPDKDMIITYVESCLLPQCLRLCVLGNGPRLTGARGSNGEYETAYGTSLYPEYTENLQSPLPDPCLDLNEHSIEALGTAHAMLRRIRMMRAAFGIASGMATLNKLDEILHSSFMRKSMDSLPVWWCPWIHDAALLVHASTQGLFSILKDRKQEDKISAFSRKTILQHMYSTFIAENALPRFVIDESPPEDSTSWIEMQANDFPSVNVLERRLAFLCSQATENSGDMERYYNLPMFDHGSWPRN
jgi:hypothetical protein